MKVCFVGLGVMGMGMALNLAKGDFDYRVIDSNPKALEQFKEKGIVVSQNVSDAAACDYIYLCLPDTKVVQSVLLGDNGLLEKMSEGQTLVDCSTISYLAAKEMGELCEKKGVRYIDAPISGHHAKAMDGTLTIMCGGKEEVFNEIKPMLDLMGTTVLYMGGYGCGQLTKMINNCALNICTASFCELLPVGVKLGLPAEKIGEVLMTASGSSYASKTLIPEILEGNFAHGFTLEKAYKDMVSMFEVTGKYALPLPTLYGTMQTYQMALQTGQGDQYKGAMIRFFENMLGVKCRKEGFENT
jgi:3-hydroxyisobutyrate dehydrogenase-like beta-hydroxyacid dehydrogenase